MEQKFEYFIKLVSNKKTIIDFKNFTFNKDGEGILAKCCNWQSRRCTLFSISPARKTFFQKNRKI